MKIHPVGPGLLHADGRTDMNLSIAFRNFANAPKKLVGVLAACVEDSEVNFEISSLYSEHPVSLSVS